MSRIIFTLLITLVSISVLTAQTISLPPSGENQKCEVTQWIGPVTITITYNSPDVTGPNGEDRRGQIWGELVPYGRVKNSFGDAAEMPWRAGANENTTIRFSHNVQIEGKDIAAGTYGLHMIPGEMEWTIIFSNNATSWGSYFYNAKEDALRVTVKSEKCAYTEWLTYEFIDKHPEHAVAALRWEELMVPFKISADVKQVYVDLIREELRGSKGFDWNNWIAACEFCVSNNINLKEALTWADKAISAPYIGEENFKTLKNKADVLAATGKKAEADQIMDQAINHPTADMRSVHYYGRQLLDEGRTEEAMKVFQLNKKRNPHDHFTVSVGMARGYAAMGNKKEARKYYQEAAKNAPEGQKAYYENLAKELE